MAFCMGFFSRGEGQTNSNSGNGDLHVSGSDNSSSDHEATGGDRETTTTTAMRRSSSDARMTVWGTGLQDSWRNRRSETHRRSKKAATPRTPRPKYKVMPRNESPLLTACWEQDWDTVRRLLQTEPDQIFHKSRHSYRTALHLATMPGANCPGPVVRALIDANPHALIVFDSHKFGGTPLHFLCGSLHRNQPDTIAQAVATTLQVLAQQQEERVQKEDPIASRRFSFRRKTTNYTLTETWELSEAMTSSSTDDVRFSFHSPLFLAAKWGAPPQTLDALVQTMRFNPLMGNWHHSTPSLRHSQSPARWIAPWTGGEDYENMPTALSLSMEGRTTKSILRATDSPLQALWTLCLRSMEEEKIEKGEKVDLSRMRDVAYQILRTHTAEEQRSSMKTLANSNNKNIFAATVDIDRDKDRYLLLWAGVVVLLRPFLDTTLLHTVARLYRPLPSLVEWTARIFDNEHLHANKKGQVPLMAALLARTDPYWKQPLQLHPVHLLVQASPAAASVPLRVPPEFNFFEEDLKDDDSESDDRNKLDAAMAFLTELTADDDDNMDDSSVGQDNTATDENMEDWPLWYPVFVAASCPHVSLNTIFSLLLEAPSVLRMQQDLWQTNPPQHNQERIYIPDWTWEIAPSDTDDSD